MEKAVNSACADPKSPIRGLFVILWRWLHRAQQKASYDKSVSMMSERQLRDIDVDPRQFVRSVDMEIERLGLLDIGWQQPRRRTRK